MKGISIVLLLALFAFCVAFKQPVQARRQDDEPRRYRRHYSDRGDRAAKGALFGGLGGAAIGGIAGGGRGAGIGLGAGLLGGALIGASTGNDYYYDDDYYDDNGYEYSEDNDRYYSEEYPGKRRSFIRNEYDPRGVE
jgi:uncharacterized protein YcfJ